VLKEVIAARMHHGPHIGGTLVGASLEACSSWLGSFYETQISCSHIVSFSQVTTLCLTQGSPERFIWIFQSSRRIFCDEHIEKPKPCLRVAVRWRSESAVQSPPTVCTTAAAGASWCACFSRCGCTFLDRPVITPFSSPSDASVR